MSIRRLLQIVLKIVTCAVGGTLAGVVFVAFEPNDDSLIGVLLLTGVFCGIAWAIENKKARRLFIAFPVTGAVLGGMSATILGNHRVFAAAILLGLFIGTVSALAAVGAYRSK